jgi:hypothetical protein
MDSDAANMNKTTAITAKVRRLSHADSGSMMTLVGKIKPHVSMGRALARAAVTGLLSDCIILPAALSNARSISSDGTSSTASKMMSWGRRFMLLSLAWAG